MGLWSFFQRDFMVILNFWYCFILSSTCTYWFLFYYANLYIIFFSVQVSSGIVSKKCRDTEATNNLKTRYILSGDETQDICLALDAVDGASINHKVILLPFFFWILPFSDSLWLSLDSYVCKVLENIVSAHLYILSKVQDQCVSVFSGQCI